MTDIEKIMDMTFCSREDAEAALKKMGNALEAICFLMEAPLAEKERTSKQKFFDDIRKNLAEMEIRNAEVLSASRYVAVERDEKQIPPEETSQQNNCSPECQLDAQVSTAKTQETDDP